MFYPISESSGGIQSGANPTIPSHYLTLQFKPFCQAVSRLIECSQFKEKMYEEINCWDREHENSNRKTSYGNSIVTLIEYTIYRCKKHLETVEIEKYQWKLWSSTSTPPGNVMGGFQSHPSLHQSSPPPSPSASYWIILLMPRTYMRPWSRSPVQFLREQ